MRACSTILYLMCIGREHLKGNQMPEDIPKRTEQLHQNMLIAWKIGY